MTNFWLVFPAKLWGFRVVWDVWVVRLVRVVKVVGLVREVRWFG